MTKASENSNNFYSISVSGGKDSSALLLLMIEKDMPIDRSEERRVGKEC